MDQRQTADLLVHNISGLWTFFLGWYLQLVTIFFLIWEVAITFLNFFDTGARVVVGWANSQAYSKQQMPKCADTLGGGGGGAQTHNVGPDFIILNNKKFFY